MSSLEENQAFHLGSVNMVLQLPTLLAWAKSELIIQTDGPSLSWPPAGGSLQETQQCGTGADFVWSTETEARAYFSSFLGPKAVREDLVG